MDFEGSNQMNFEGSDRMDFEGSDQRSPNQACSQNSHGSNGASSQPPRVHSNLPWVVNFEGRSRYFCPVNDCPHANVTHARGWANIQGVRNHLREHYAGRFSGAVPQAFLDAHKLCSCSVCGKIISLRSNRVCPVCRLLHRAMNSNNSTDPLTTAGFAIPR